MDTASWIIRHKGDGLVIAETWSPAVVAALNTATYEAVPILVYLGELNQRIREGKARV